LPLHGHYNVVNCLAAAACAHSLGVSLEEIGKAVTQAKPAPSRGVVHTLAGNARVIDDSYNSNPAALSAALRGAREVGAKRHWAILGDMLELGSDAPMFHRAVGQEAAELGFSPVVGVGELAQEIVAGARDRGADGRWYASAPAAAQEVSQELQAGDVVLVKGSRAVGLEVVIRVLVANGRGVA
jgi:UDP-N-acetylmuramoyl-tripeptide--D-alanyl-D-alanine ligase